MDIQFKDFNGADTIINRQRTAEWAEIEQTLIQMPLHVKASGQRGRIGNLVFDPVGTNAYIDNSLLANQWQLKVPLPDPHRHLGQGVDLMKNGVVVEAQFSNYPFLHNNTFRLDVLYKLQVPLAGSVLALLVTITKAHMFPAANSTLYYEQAESHLSSLIAHNVFTIPIRLVGLFEKTNTPLTATSTTYTGPYSRTIVSQAHKQAEVVPGKAAQSRCTIRLL